MPIYRRDYTRLQERLYPSTGEIIPVYREANFQSYPFTGSI
jgi:hypothetical protein